MKHCKHCKVPVVQDSLGGYMHQPTNSSRHYDQYVFCKITQAEPEEEQNGGETIPTGRRVG